jgi:hypothetical protein
LTSRRDDIVNKVFAALSSEPYIFILEKSDDEAERIVENVLKDEGLWGLVRKENAGTLIIYYIDKSKLAKLCSYESCSTIENNIEFEACVQKCVDAKIENIIKKRAG